MAETPSTQPAETPPVPEYDTLTAEQVKAWAATITEKVRAAALAYETAHQNRPEVLEALGAPSPGGVQV